VEFLPIAQHPFAGSWGYQVTGFYAPSAVHGTPDDFRYLVDRLHRAGIGVLVDWVPVLVHSMDRLARNLDDLRATVRNLTTRGVRVQFMKEQLTFNGDDTAIATLMLSVMGAFAEFERALIKERQREGTALAKQRGAYRDRRKALTADQVDRLRAGAGAGEPKAALAREFGISRETVYQYLRADT